MNRPTPDEIRAEPAGRRLDAWVAEIVCGWTGISEDDHYATGLPPNCLGFMPSGIPGFSLDWSAAGPLLESPFFWTIDKVEDKGILIIGVWHPDGVEEFYVDYDRTKPNDLCRAICIARILAVLEGK